MTHQFGPWSSNGGLFLLGVVALLGGALALAFWITP